MQDWTTCGLAQKGDAVKCQKAGANGGCGTCEACTAAYDWGEGAGAGTLYDQAQDAWHRAGMEGMSAKDRSRFCDMLERIAGFLQAARLAQQDYASPMLASQMQHLSDATWEMEAPSALSDPRQIARAERVLDGKIMPSVNGIASVVKNVSKKGGKKSAASTATIKEIPNLQSGIEQDRDAIVANFTRYRTSVTRAQMSARAKGTRRARVSAGASAAGPSTPSARAPLPTQPRKNGGSWSAAMALAQGGPVAGPSGPGRQRQYEGARTRASASGAAADVMGRIGSRMTQSSGADAFAMSPYGSEEGPITYPRLTFGLDTRGGQDLFAAPGIAEGRDFSEPAPSRNREDKHVYVQSGRGSAESAGRLTR